MSGAADPQRTPGRGGATPPGGRSSFLRWLVLGFVLLLVINYLLAHAALNGGPARLHIPYSPTFLAQVKAGNVEDITATDTLIQGGFRRAVRYPDRAGEPSSRLFETDVPVFANMDSLSALLESKGVVVNAKQPRTTAPLWETLLYGFGPAILLVALLVWLMRRAGGLGAGASGMFGFGRARPRRYEAAGGRRVTFADVAGIDEAKEELTEVVDFLRHPERYRRLGGRIPRGVLLYGPPGTGKTLLARAVAGEASVPYFSMSASEFVEMIVGVGASRVRDLFVQAKQASPAILFIDELDAIGRSRAGAVSFASNDEREQTLNQILTEMDGFDSSTSVIVLAATNRPEVLDPALLRPGRFDRRVAVQPPDRVGREAILRVHTRAIPLGDDVDLAAVASSTTGMVGADLANLANEAALLAARRGHPRVAMRDFTDALEKIMLGAERKITLSPADRERTAFHEGGHALVGMLTPDADPVRKVSIVPRGIALGATLSTPDDDRVSYSESALLGRIKVALGGRVAEEIVYGDVTTGAEADLRQLTQLARQMVGRWGMSPAIGPVAVLPADGVPSLPGAATPSQRTQELVDEEVRRIVEDAHAEVTDLLTENRERLDSIAHALLARETIDAAEAYAAAGLDPKAPGAAATGAPGARRPALAGG